MNTQSNTAILENVQTKTRYAPHWQVIGINDDVTPMDYVMLLLIDIFHKSHEDAFKLMMTVHEVGAAPFYFGTREACELKVEQVSAMNKTYDEKLIVSIEVVDE